MEIKITFEIEKNSRETIDKLSTAIEKLGRRTMSDAVFNIVAKEMANSRNFEGEYAEQVEEEQKEEEKVKETPVAEATVEAPAQEVEHEPSAPDIVPVAETPAATEVPKATTPSYSNEQLTEFCSQASQLGLGSKVKDLIRNEFGVQKVSDLAEGTREDFVNKLRELGVRI